MARTGSPDDPNNYSDGDPTQYANVSGTGGEAYSEYGTPGDQPPTGYGRVPPPVPPPWYQRPAALVGLGVLTAGLLALLVYAVVTFTDSGTSSPAGTSTTTTPTSSAAPITTESAAPAPTTQATAESPSTNAPLPPPTTATVTVTTPATTPTTTPAPTPSTTASVTTVTETTTKRLFPTLPTRLVPPTLYEPPPGG